MKFLMKIGIMVWVALMGAHANPYVYLDELYVTLESSNITVHNGTPVTVLSQDDTMAEVTVSGFVFPDTPKTLYATKNGKVVLAETDTPLEANAKGEATLTFAIGTDRLEEDVEIVWETNMDEFYNSCTQCHAANEPYSHTMVEWDGLYGSMKEFAKPTPEQDVLILRFLRAFASDGFVKLAY